LALAALPLAAAAPPTDDGGLVAVQAGTLHLVDGGAVLEDGTILIRDGKIEAIGTEVEIPSGARVVDYGPDAVIVPGLVAADSSYGSSRAAERTASPSLRALDNFDPYSELRRELRAGVTSVYLAPARGRLIAGQGAVVKTGGEPEDDRVVSDSAVIHGSISAEARSTPGYWKPPVPATVDVGLGVEQPQLPRTTMGAEVALRELLALVGGDEDLVEEYGIETGPALQALMEAKRPWRMGAHSPEEVRALLAFFAEAGLPLVLDGARGVDEEAAAEIAAAGVPVIASVATHGGSDFGKGPDAPWPNTQVVSTLAEAGVKLAVSGRRPGALRLDLALARRGGGLDETSALRAITLGAAEVLGVADQVGSLTPGKDADLAVFSGPPLEITSTVQATWISGEVVWKAKESAAVVLEVDELHVGDGKVLAPGQLLMSGGRIVEVGTRVAHPSGATVVRGAAAMPGMIDTLGYLGLEGSQKPFSTRFDLTRLVEPGDEVDRQVARYGVTTVNLGGRRASGQTMVYKPAGSDPSRMVVDAAATMRMKWSEDVPSDAGEAVRKTLEKAAEYKQKWEEYEKAIAAWTPPEPEAAAEEEEEEEDEDAEEEEDDDKKKKKKEKSPPRPVTGEWKGKATVGEEEPALRLRLLERDLVLEGTLRAEGLDELISLEGEREEYAVRLRGRSSLGDITLELELDEQKLTGTGQVDGTQGEVALEQVCEEYPVAKRPERRRPEPPPKDPKGKPKPPGIDPKLEPIRQAMFGRAAVIVEVGREDEILECVAEFERYGIRPILWGASGAPKVAGALRGRVAGILTRSSVVTLSQAGIPVAFYSQAEEGAAELALQAANAIASGMGSGAALRALTGDAARMLAIDDRVGTLAEGKDADVLLLDGSPLDISSSVVRTWVNGEEVR